jgi:hypothetical protein
MVRLVFAGVMVLAFAGAVAAEEDHGPMLIDLFAKTCARRPALPSEIERMATGLDFVSDGHPISAAMENGPQIDILYMARLTQRGENVSLTAYFAGPADAPTVICTLSAVGVSAEALPDLIEKSLKPGDRTDKASADDNRRQANWRLGAAGEGDALDMSAWRTPPRRAAINIEYRAGKR